MSVGSEEHQARLDGAEAAAEVSLPGELFSSTAIGDQATAMEPEGGRMTLWEHLDEARRRIIWSALAVLVATIGGWFLYNPILRFVTKPYSDFVHKHGGITPSLVISGPAEGFTTRLQVSTYVGLGLAAPVVLWHLWRFITPGLHKKEKRYAIPFVVSAVGLFAFGVLVAVLVWPRALDWLISASGTSVTPLFSPSRYLGLYTMVCLVFGAVFLYPIVVVFLMISGAVPTRKWRKWRRYAIVVLCIVAAVVTPSNDPFTFLAMAVPMVVFYELSILVGRLLKK